MTMIELGDLASGSPRKPPREFDRRILRRIALVVVAVLTVLSVTGSARPEPHGVRMLWSIGFRPDDRYAATTDSVYAATISTGGALTAYDLTDGSVRWSKRMPAPTGGPVMAEAAGVLMLPADRVARQVDSPFGSYVDVTYRTTVAIDARTGAELWRQPGDVYLTTGDLAVLADWDDHGGAIRGLRAVRVRDGGIVWHRSGLAADRIAPGGADRLNPDVLVTVTAGGAAETIRVADGVRTATGHLTWQPSAPEQDGFRDLEADAAHVYIRLVGSHGPSLTAYALDTLRQVWHLDDTGRVSVAPCGAVVCSIEGDGYAALDPDTGATRWRAAGVQDVHSAGPGRLVADEGANDVYALLDDRTGRRIASLGFGVPLLDDRSRTGYLLHDTLSPRNRTAVSRVDLVTGAVRLRGTIARVGDVPCTATADHLICPNPTGRLTVTAVD